MRPPFFSIYRCSLIFVHITVVCLLLNFHLAVELHVFVRRIIRDHRSAVPCTSRLSSRGRTFWRFRRCRSSLDVTCSNFSSTLFHEIWNRGHFDNASAGADRFGVCAAYGHAHSAGKRGGDRLFAVQDHVDEVFANVRVGTAVRPFRRLNFIDAVRILAQLERRVLTMTLFVSSSFSFRVAVPVVIIEIT